jgi:lipopolysaccharide export system permease protein
MRIFDLYVFRQTLKPLVLSLVIALAVLLIERMLRLLDLVLGAEGPLKIMFEIMAFLVPHYIGLALPLSLLIGVMIAFNRLSRDGEVDALQGAGISLLRQSCATVVVALLVTAITAGTLGYLKPFGRYAYQAMVFAVSNAAFQTLLRPGVFAELDDTTFLIQSIRAESGTFTKVFLYESKPSGSTVITARDGDLIRTVEEGPPLLRLFDGVRLTLRNGQQAAARPAADDAPPAGVLQFTQLRMGLGQDEQRMFRRRGVDEREYTLTELWQRRHDPPAGVRQTDMVAEFHGRLARILSVPFLPLLGIPLALGQRRSERSYGIGIGLLVIILYNQILDLGENMAETGDISVIIGLWLPFAVFASGTLWMFLRASTRVGTAGFSLSLPQFLVRGIDAGLARIGRRF